MVKSKIIPVEGERIYIKLGVRKIDGNYHVTAMDPVTKKYGRVIDRNYIKARDKSIKLCKEK